MQLFAVDRIIAYIYNVQRKATCYIVSSKGEMIIFYAKGLSKRKYVWPR